MMIIFEIDGPVQFIPGREDGFKVLTSRNYIRKVKV